MIYEIFIRNYKTANCFRLPSNPKLILTVAGLIRCVPSKQKERQIHPDSFSYGSTVLDLRVRDEQKSRSCLS